MKDQPACSHYRANAHPSSATIWDQNWQHAPILAAYSGPAWQHLAGDSNFHYMPQQKFQWRPLVPT